MPELQAVADELAPRGVELVTVMLDGTAARAAFVAERSGLRAPVVLGDRQLMATMNADSYPWTLVVGPDGKTRVALRGGRDRAELKREIERHLR